jgi:hypothetical protein
MMWILIICEGADNCIEWFAPVRPSDFLPLSRVGLLDSWHSNLCGRDMERYAHSVSDALWAKRVILAA